MGRLSHWFNQKIEATVALAIYLTISILLNWRQHEALNTDAIAYFRLAEYWSTGRFSLAVSGYWSPMFVWLIAAFRQLGVPVMAAGRLSMIISGVVFLLGSVTIVRRMVHKDLCRTLLLFSVAFVAAVWSCGEITPDLLVSGLSLIFLSNLLFLLETKDRLNQLLTGTIWGLGYLAKAVALPAGLLWVLLGLFWKLSRQGLRYWPEASVVGLRLAVGCGLLALPWVCILSLKYGTLTFSTAARAAHAVMAPGWSTSLHPFGLQLYAVPRGRITIWEDPTCIDYPYWSPFQSLGHFCHQLRIMLANLLIVAGKVAQFDLLALCLPILFFGGPLLQRLNCPNGLLLWLFCWAWICLFLPVYADQIRYFYVLFPCLLVLGLVLIDKLKQLLATFLPIPARYLRILLVCSVIAAGVRQAAFSYKDERSVASRVARELADSLKKSYASDDTIAGSGFFLGQRIGLYVAFFAGIPWVGDEDGLPQEKLDRLAVRWIVLSPRRREVNELLSRGMWNAVVRPGQWVGAVRSPIWLLERAR